jgi:hypothetical protein
MSEYATADNDKPIAFRRYLTAKKLRPACACGRRAVRYRFASIGKARAGADATSTPVAQCAGCARGETRSIADADRNRRLKLLQLASSTPTRAIPSPRRSVTARRFRSDAERLAALRRLQAER